MNLENKVNLLNKVLNKTKGFIINNKNLTFASSLAFIAGMVSVYTTMDNVYKYGSGGEINPLVKYVINNFGAESLYYTKTATLGALITGTYFVNKKFKNTFNQNWHFDLLTSYTLAVVQTFAALENTGITHVYNTLFR